MFFVLTLSLFHVFFKNTNPKELEQLSLYAKKVKERDAFFLKHFKSINDEKGEKAYLDYKKELLIIKKAKHKYAKEFSFFGRKSKHFWIFIFGIVLGFFYFSVKSLFDEFSRGSTFKHQFTSICGIIVSSFWLIHLFFFTQKDFNKNTYFTMILVCAILMSFFTYYLVKYYTYKDQVINNLLGVLHRIKSKHYPKIAYKAFYYQRNNQSGISGVSTVEEDIEKFDVDLKETINKIA